MKHGLATPIFVLGAFLLCTCEAFGISPPPYKPTPNDISLDLAVQGARAAIEACKKIDEKVAVAVVDRDEHIRALLVSDGFDRDWLISVQRLAHTVLKTGMSSGDYGNSFNKNYGAMADAQSADHGLSMVPGAVPIKKSGVIVGVVSVAGSNAGTASNGLGHEYMGPVEICAVAGRDTIEPKL